MPGPGSVSTPAVAAAGVGALVLWSALKGASVTGGLRALLSGKQPSAANTQPITGSAAAGGATGSVIADAGLRYAGSGSVYKWGGGTPQGWDCSGFVNWVVGHDLGQPIPGSHSGAYSGHGPTTVQWALFGAGILPATVQPGDLVIWPLFHMGIVTGNGQMVNCPGPNGSPAPVVSGYGSTGIPGAMVFRRLG